jgi:hypothetical protein
MKRLACCPVLVLAACATPPTEPEAWPQAIPTRSYYEKSYANDPINQKEQSFDDYLVWVIRFYHGYGIAEGWKKSEAKLMDGMEPSEIVLLHPKVAYLGMLMSSEWAKHNKKRRITTEMLVLWGQVMTQAKADKHIETVVDRLIGDVRALIIGELKPKEIKTARYSDVLPQKPAGNGNGGGNR